MGALNEITETWILHDLEVTEKRFQKGLSLLKHDEASRPFYVKAS